MGKLIAWAALAAIAPLLPVVAAPQRIACEGVYPLHPQGVATDGTNVFWSFTVVIVKTDLAGKVLARFEIGKDAAHVGDICCHDGRLYAGVENYEVRKTGASGNEVWVFGMDGLDFLDKHPTPEAVWGNGGIGFYDGSFYVVGNAPKHCRYNMLFRYARDFTFKRCFLIDSGWTNLGVQTICTFGDKVLLGCWGDPGDKEQPHNPCTLVIDGKELTGRKPNVKPTGIVSCERRVDSTTHQGMLVLDGRLMAVEGVRLPTSPGEKGQRWTASLVPVASFPAAFAGDASGDAPDVPEWNDAQKAFFKMSPAERRVAFTNKAWRAAAASACAWRKAKPGETSRFVRLGRVPNMRDFGGLKTQDGKTFRSGLLFRSGGLNGNATVRMVTNESGKVTRRYGGRGEERLDKDGRDFATATLGLRTDLDLRGPGECAGMAGSPLGPRVSWVRTSFLPYAGLFSPEGKAAFAEAFQTLLDETGYPLVFHCISGADRTGTLAFIVEALCGVSDAELLLDWELTVLTTDIMGFAHKERYDRLVEGFGAYPGATMREKVEAFVCEQGFTRDEIDRLRNFLLTDGVEPPATMPVIDARPGYMKLHAKALELAGRHMENVPGWKPQMACFPGVRTIWQWDSCLLALYAGYTPGGLNGLGNLDNLYSLQSDDGYISMAYEYDTREPTWPGRVNPPLYAWCEWLYARRTGDLSRLPRAYDVCSRYFRWLKANRTRKNGLYWFEDTGSCMDNSPRSGYWAYDLKGSDTCFVDFCCEQVLAAKCLAKIAAALGKDGDTDGWMREADGLAALVNRLMWCEKTGFYHDVYVDTNNKLAVKTSAAFWALVSGVADGAKAARLADHLDNPATFGSLNPVPSLAREDPNYDPKGGYWLGGVWPPVVYMVCRGLRAQGMAGRAREIAKRHLDCMLAVMESPDWDNTIWECYSPESVEPATKYGGKRCRKDFVGWGGLGPLVMLVEDIIGLDIRAIDKCIDWTISEPGRQGLRNFPFNGGTVTLLADTDPETGRVAVEVSTDRPFHLKVVSTNGCVILERDFASGQHTAFGRMDKQGL